MQPDKLVHMANQIAGFFRSYSDDEAILGISDHIKSFWSATMRDTLIRRGTADPQGIDPLVLAALRNGFAIVQKDVTDPISKETASPEEAGEMGSDAG